MSQENTNIERVRLAYELSYPARSIEPIKQWISRDFRWHQRREWPGRLVYKADELPQLWADIDDTYSEFTLVPEDFTEVGEYVIVTVRNSARLRGSDERVEGTIFHVWHVPNGIGLEAWVYSDREEALEAVGLRE